MSHVLRALRGAVVFVLLTTAPQAQAVDTVTWESTVVALGVAAQQQNVAAGVSALEAYLALLPKSTGAAARLALINQAVAEAEATVTSAKVLVALRQVGVIAAGALSTPFLIVDPSELPLEENGIRGGAASTLPPA